MEGIKYDAITKEELEKLLQEKKIEKDIIEKECKRLTMLIKEEDFVPQLYCEVILITMFAMCNFSSYWGESILGGGILGKISLLLLVWYNVWKMIEKRRNKLYIEQKRIFMHRKIELEQEIEDIRMEIKHSA